MSKKKWQYEVVQELLDRTSSIEEVYKNGTYHKITMANGDVGSVHRTLANKFEEGDEVSYSLEKRLYYETQPDEPDAWHSNVLKGLKLKNQGIAIRELRGVSPSKIMFLDIEAAAPHKKLLKKDHPELWNIWESKMSRQEDNPTTNELKKMYEERAPLYPEFSKVCCVSLGIITDGVLKIQSFYGEDEREILEGIAPILEKEGRKKKPFQLCGHAIKGYDAPLLMKRFLAHGMPVPDIIDVSGLKPWDITMIDTNEIWKASSFTAASMSSIAYTLGLEPPKAEMDGSQVNKKFHSGKLEEIRRYCEKDVYCVANIVMKLMGQNVITNTFSVVDNQLEEEE